MIRGEVVARLGMTFDAPVAAWGDMRVLRDSFAALMDQMASELMSQKLDLDDCVLEREATLRCVATGVESVVPVESVTDGALLHKSFIDKRLRDSVGEETVLAAIALIAVRAPDYPSQIAAH